MIFLVILGLLWIPKSTQSKFEVLSNVKSFQFDPITFQKVFQELLQLKSFKLGKESWQTRSKSNLFFLFCRIDLNKQSLNYSGPLIYNKIPPTIREKKSFTSFKKQYNQQVLILE